MQLVITDIEGSTSLWEQLDESVMDLALHLHHACMRKHITASVGVEAQVEGDSFVVAFHNVNDAVTFCMAVQVCTHIHTQTRTAERQSSRGSMCVDQPVGQITVLCCMAHRRR